MKKTIQTHKNYIEMYLGNHLNILDNFENNSIDLIVSSPPYGSIRDYNGYKYDIKKLAPKLFNTLKSGGRLCWIIKDQVVNWDLSGQSFSEWFILKENGFKANQIIIYGKKGVSYGFAFHPKNKNYPDTIEFIFVFSKDNPLTFNPIMKKNIKKVTKNEPYRQRQRDGSLKVKTMNRNLYSPINNVWFYDTGFNNMDKNDEFVHNHPAPFPLQLAYDLINSFSNVNDIILDPMGGSGTTNKAALLLNRNSVYIDCSEEYFNNAHNRFEHSKERIKKTKNPKQLESFIH